MRKKLMYLLTNIKKGFGTEFDLGYTCAAGFELAVDNQSPRADEQFPAPGSTWVDRVRGFPVVISGIP